MSKAIDGRSLELARKLASSALTDAQDNSYRHEMQARAGYESFTPEIATQMKDQRRLWGEAKEDAEELIKELT